MATIQFTTPVTHTTPSTATQKARLVADALQTLQAAHALDERDSLDVAEWVAWYDATIPQVKDIKILAGVMEIEMVRRRGEQVQQEGEQRRGRTQAEKVKVEHRSTLTKAEKDRRHQARKVAAHPKEVEHYVKTEVEAQRVPSVRGAVRAAASHGAGCGRVGAQTRVENALAAVTTALGRVADGRHWTDRELERVAGDIENFLRRIRLVPWLWIDRTPAGTRFVIDQELRDICEARQPRPPKGESVKAFLGRVRAEIRRRRKENHDQKVRANWSPRDLNLYQQSQLLDWIEAELETITT